MSLTLAKKTEDLSGADLLAICEGEAVVVSIQKMCDLCKYDLGKPNVFAKYDARTRGGQWANMCESHMRSDGRGLGTGYGQRLIVIK